MSENSETVTAEQETVAVDAKTVAETEMAATAEAADVDADEVMPPSAEASTSTAEAEVEADVEAVMESTAESDENPAETSEEVSAVDAPTVDDATSVADTKGSKEPNEPERVVRVLSVGMEVEGTVKRTTDFGAFVDIGVGRDGLIHISELSVRRVAKVSDVVKEGQAIKAWIKELDRSRNRISLTLIPPGTKTIRDLEKDEIVTGKVTRIVPYGAFVDIGVGRDALLHIREMADGYINKPEDVVEEGATVEARIIEISRRRGRIDLSMKGMNPEAEAEEEAEVEAEEDESVDDPFEDMEVLSPMELAFQKAMSQDDKEVEGVTRRRNKRTRRQQMRSMQDEIIARTLDTGRQG